MEEMSSLHSEDPTGKTLLEFLQQMRGKKGGKRTLAPKKGSLRKRTGDEKKAEGH